MLLDWPDDFRKSSSSCSNSSGTPAAPRNSGNALTYFSTNFFVPGCHERRISIRTMPIRAGRRQGLSSPGRLATRGSRHSGDQFCSNSLSQVSRSCRSGSARSGDWANALSTARLRHAAAPGRDAWALANRRQAVMSSGSRSGNSATTSAGDNPAASRSSTSLTRMRILRTQGRPPHCCGLTVMRSVVSMSGPPGTVVTFYTLPSAVSCRYRRPDILQRDQVDRVLNTRAEPSLLRQRPQVSDALLKFEFVKT